jgi:hypothetical protein
MEGAVQPKTRPNYLSHVVSETWVVVRVHETSLLWSSESADGCGAVSSLGVQVAVCRTLSDTFLFLLNGPWIAVWSSELDSDE